MVAALLHNRIAGEFPAQTRMPLPECERERGRLWNGAVLEAVLALQNQLGSRNEGVAAAAVNSILELERTRMRHHKTVSGTRDDRLRDESQAEESRPVPVPANDPIFTAAEEAQVAGPCRRSSCTTITCVIEIKRLPVPMEGGVGTIAFGRIPEKPAEPRLGLTKNGEVRRRIWG